MAGSLFNFAKLGVLRAFDCLASREAAGPEGYPAEMVRGPPSLVQPAPCAGNPRVASLRRYGFSI